MTSSTSSLFDKDKKVIYINNLFDFRGEVNKTIDSFKIQECDRNDLIFNTLTNLMDTFMKSVKIQDKRKLENVIPSIKKVFRKLLEDKDDEQSQKYDEVKFKEFQESSRELEQELEAQLTQSEKKIKDLESSLSRSQMDNESLKNKLTQVTKEKTEKIHQLQQTLVEYEAVNLKLSHTIRALEQSNDDLERAQRALIASLESLESQLNQQIEKNVLLETITSSSSTSDQNNEPEIT